MSNASPLRRSLYYVLVSSGMRLGEALTLTKNNLDLSQDVIHEDGLFGYLREKIGFTEKYRGSIRYKVRIRELRSYFHTKASQKHSAECANSLDGHTGYLEQYYALTPERRSEMYKELEPELLIESVPVETDHTQDKIIDTLQEQMAKIQDEMQRMIKTPNRIEVANNYSDVLRLVP